MLKTIIMFLAIITACQVIQTVRYLATDADAGSGALPVIIEGISSKAANGSHALPVKVERPVRMVP